MRKTSLKNRLLSLALCLCMVLSLMPMISPEVYAESGNDGMIDPNAVAYVTVGDEVAYYTTLDSAIQAVAACTAGDGAVITLMKDVNLGDSYLDIREGSFTLDLNGKTLSGESDHVLYINTWASKDIVITVKDSVGDGKIHGAGTAITIWESTVVLQGITLSNGDKQEVVYIDDYSTVTISDCTIEGSKSYSASIGSHGVHAYESSVTVENSTVYGSGSGLYIGSEAEVTVNDCDITGRHGVEVVSGSVTICGGSIDGSEVDIYYNEYASTPGTVRLTVGEDGVGASFPGGITVIRTTLSEMLGEGVGYWQGDKMIVPAEGDTELTGDVTVKTECKHENNTNTVEDCTVDVPCSVCGKVGIEAAAHTPGEDDGNCATEVLCTVCGKVAIEGGVAHLGGKATCTEKAVCASCGESYGEILPHSFGQDGICTGCGMKGYPIFLGGVQVNDDNAADILGDGTASYDAATGTLTLNNATVDMTETNLAIHNNTQQEHQDRIDNGEIFEPYFNPLTPALQITGGELTLELQGKNTLIGLPEILASNYFEDLIYGVPAVSIADGAALTVTGDDTATLTLLSDDIGYTEIDHIPSASSISGGSLTVAGGTVTTVNGIRLTGDYTQTGGLLEVGYLAAQNVTVSDGILNAKGYSGIYPQYFDPNAGGIHGIFARETINVSGGKVTSSSGTVGHNGDYRGYWQVTGETITTHGLYALASITVSGGTVTSTGCAGGYMVGDMGDLILGGFVEENVGPSPGAALVAPIWSIDEEATFICGSDASHRDGIATCVDPLACQFCGVERGELDASNHAGPYTVQYKWYPYTDGTCYVSGELYCDGCDAYIDGISGDAELVEEVAPVNCQNPGSRTWSFTCTLNGQEYSEAHTETVYNDVHIVFDGNGFCTSCGGYQKPTVDPGEDPEWDYDDVYLIYNAGQLYWFADHVNNVSNGITGKLMANIDLNPGYTFHADGTYTGGDTPRMWTPIGSGFPCYAGNFDGNGFTVSGAYAVSEGSYVGLFGNTDYNYNITNLGISNSYFKGADHVGGLIGYAYTTVKNCYVTDTVYVSGSHATAALVGYNGGEIINCYAMADTLVDSGWGTVTNSFYLAEEETDSNEGTTALTAEDFVSGEVAYLLQSGVAEDGYYDENDNWVTFIPEIWGQSIGTDSYPVLKGAKVYQVTNCKNETVYSNTDENIEHIPVEDDGDCTTPVNCSVCGDVLIAAKADHDLSYTNNGDDHSYTCSNCDVAATEAHSYTNFLCACGLVSPDAVATVVSGDGAMYFATFADALSAWTDGTTLQLLQNVEYAEMITVTGKRILDLNGKVIHCQCSDSNMGFNLFNIEGDLTIRDSGENGTITLRGTNHARVITSVGNLTIESGHIDGQHFGINCEGGTLNISGGTVSANYAVDLVNTEATVSNGKIQGGHITVDIADGASLVVTGGEISASGVAIQVGQDAKSAVISGGSLSGTGYGVECYGNVTISGNVVIDAEYGDFYFTDDFPDARVIIDCPLADGSYTVKMDEPGAFAVAGEGITLNPKAFTAYNENYKIVEDDEGLSMVPCDHSNGFAADGACLDCGKILQFNILVDGVIITTANMSDVLSDGTVSYDSATKTLILNNAQIEDAVYADGDTNVGLGILAEQDLNIRLVGDCFISSGASESMSVAILCYGNLTITGNGTLIAQCGQAQEMLSIAAIESFTVDANVSVTVSDFVQCGSYSIPGQFNGILKVGFGPYDYVACGNAVLSRDLTVNGNNDTATMEHIGEFTVLEGATLTIADGVTLTIADNSELASTEVNNIFTNKGKVILEGSGTIVNLGEGICTETATHCFDSESKCLICGYTCPHSWLDATCTAPKTCTICGATEGEALGHSYENNVCTVCGHIGVPVKLDSASLSFKEKIHYNIFFSLGIDENVDLSDMGLVMFDSLNADGTVDDAIAIYSGAVEVDGKYMIATDGVHAKRLGDTIYFRVYAKLADGSYVYSKTVQYSAVTYAEHILAGDQPESAKALVVAMLNYGAAAQKFFGYNTDNLVNAFLTEEQKALPEQYRDDMVSTVPVVAAEKQGSFANNKGFSKRMPAVSFEGAFEINYFFTPAYAPVDGITLYYWTEADFEANEVLTADNATGSIRLEGTGMEQYHGDIGGIAAKNLSQTVYVAAVYSDGTTTWTSGVLGYSIGAYCASQATKGGTIADLAMATAVYGYHARQYFGN